MTKFLAETTVAVHILALLFIGLGGFLAWRWPKVLFGHVFFAIWGVLVNITPIPCPLTALENYFRHQQGLGDLPGGFNAYYLYGHVIPRSLLPAVGVLAIAIVLISYVGAYQRWRHREHGSTPAHPIGLG
jgi:hypothetical protein